MSACGDDEAIVNPGGTLPPIETTTTLSPSETTNAPYTESHRLVAGETLRVVAELYNVPLSSLIEYNAERLGGNLDNVPVGTEIIIPPHRWIETLPPLPSTTGPEA